MFYRTDAEEADRGCEVNAQELADKFTAKVADAIAKRDEQTTIAACNKEKRLDDAGHCKRQLAEAVIPFLQELHSKLQEQFTYAHFSI